MQFYHLSDAEGEALVEAFETNRTLTKLKFAGRLSHAVVQALGKTMQNNQTIVTLETQVPLAREALSALARNRELGKLWVNVARVVRCGESPGLRAVVDVLTPRQLRENVFRFFWPKSCVRSMTEEHAHFAREAAPERSSRSRSPRVSR